MEFFFKVKIKDKNNMPIWEHCSNSAKDFDGDERTFDFFRNKGMFVETITLEGLNNYPLDDNFKLKL